MAENKIENSIHYKFILDCIAKGLSTIQIRKALLEKGYSLSIPTIRKFMVDVKKKGINVTQFESNTQSAALAINDKIKSINILATFESKNNLLVRYNVKKNSQGYSLEIDNSEVEVNEKE